MKILSGRYKGRNIIYSENSLTHPMGEREKNALFNMVGDVTGLNVLDWFAGSGQLGLEALSRGAKNVTFIEKYPLNIKNIKKNLSLLGEESDFLRAPKGKFDLIIADPPYDKFNQSSLKEVANYLTKDGVFILSSPKNLVLDDFDKLQLVSSHTYAVARISFYKIA